MISMADYLLCFPPGAQEVLVRTKEDGTRHFEYTMNGALVGTRSVFPDGETWATAISDGQRHGPERFWNPQGILVSEEHYEHGKLHGTARQWSDDGTLIGLYRLEHGTGLDLWRDNVTWTLSEERQRRDGLFHGFIRWWNGDDRTIHEEGHFKEGREHGVFRQWNKQGRLRRGFPRYFIAGERIGRRKYLRACKDDPTLPPFRQEDNRPERPLPQEYVDQVAQGIGPRRCGECYHVLRGMTGPRCPECGERI